MEMCVFKLFRGAEAFTAEQLWVRRSEPGFEHLGLEYYTSRPASLVYHGYPMTDAFAELFNFGRRIQGLRACGGCFFALQDLPYQALPKAPVSFPAES